MPVPKTARGTEAKARRVRAYFKRAGFGVGGIYPPDSTSDDEEDDWKFWVYAADPREHDDAPELGEIHVTPNGVRAEGIEARSPAPILERLLRK